MDYETGNIIGDNNITYIKEINSYFSPKGIKLRKALFKCHCNNKFETFISNIKNGHTKSCGCLRYIRTKHTSTYKGGISDHKLYQKWEDMKQRCYNKNSVEYKNYGRRGVIVCDKWVNDPWSYIHYIESLPNAYKKGLEIDRIKNNEIYKPGNLRWTTSHVQKCNRRIQHNNTTGYIGIYWHKATEKWMSRITINKKIIHLGMYTNIKRAIDARNNYITKHNLVEYKIQRLSNNN